MSPGYREALSYCLNQVEASVLAKASVENKACDHLARATPGEFPFEIEMVLDGQSGFTDAIVRCRSCAQAYLIEMLDWSPPRYVARTFRVSLLADDVVVRYAHNRERASCDLKRAAAEWYAVQTQARLTNLSITLDVDDATLVAVRLIPQDTDIPMAHWRERIGSR
jgi:hypothetical protein